MAKPVELKKTGSGLAQRAQLKEQADKAKEEDERKKKLKTWEDLNKNQKDDLVKQMAIILGLVKSS